MKVFQLGTIVEDKPSCVDGMLTHMLVNMGGNIEYLFQPKKLNPKSKHPVRSIFITDARIVGGKEIDFDLSVANQILGTKAKDFTGFEGTAVNIVYHMNGCIHIGLKPEGVSEDTGDTFDVQEFDIRRLTGEAIVPLTEEQLRKSFIDKPSPEALPKIKRY